MEILKFQIIFLGMEFGRILGVINWEIGKLRDVKLGRFGYRVT